ncbi:hypothetical protein ASG99_07985 [Bacillus sp. Soil768D1]|nr:hypothetical protein ASG99_07985 [Bacillus sp. Soil768D1]
MKWKGRQGNSNVEDKRGMSGKGVARIGGGVGLVLNYRPTIWPEFGPLMSRERIYLRKVISRKH